MGNRSTRYIFESMLHYQKSFETIILFRTGYLKSTLPSFWIFEIPIATLKKVRLMICTLICRYAPLTFEGWLLHVNSHPYTATLPPQHIPRHPTSISWHTHGAIYCSFRATSPQHVCSLTTLQGHSFGRRIALPTLGNW